MTSRSDPLDPHKLASRRSRLSVDYDYFTRITQSTLECHESTIIRATRLGVSKLRRNFLPHYFRSVPGWRLFLRRSSNRRVLPDFGVIGPVKSGTSDLAATLLCHPNVISPLVKEFDSPNPLQWRKFYPTQAAVCRHQKRHGSCLSAFVAPYLHSLEVASTLASMRPATKIVINLRNPLELVFSEWKWCVLHTERDILARTPMLTTFSSYVDRALDVFPSVEGPIGVSLHNGIYVHAVSHWLACFGEENVRIFDVAEYFADRGAYLERMGAFVGLQAAPLPKDLPIANRNPLELPPPSARTLSKLREFFEPYNRQLWTRIGTVYCW